MSGTDMQKSATIDIEQVMGETEDAVTPCPKPRAKKTSTVSQYTRWHGMGWLQSRSRVCQSTIDDAEEEVEVEWRVLPKAWLRLKGFTLNQNKTFGQWRYTFTPMCIRPDHSRIFSACREGKLDEVIKLVESGVASIFDTSEDGWTLLHVSEKAPYLQRQVSSSEMEHRWRRETCDQNCAAD